MNRSIDSYNIMVDTNVFCRHQKSINNKWGTRLPLSAFRGLPPYSNDKMYIRVGKAHNT